MNKKIIIAIFSLLLLLPINSIKATSEKIFEKEFNTPDEINNIEKTITIDNIDYTLKDIILLDAKDTQSEKDEKQTLDIITNTDNKDEVLKLFDTSIEYDKDKFKGILEIDKNTLNITLTNDGIYKDIIELNKNYDGLSETDLELIPKTVTENGIEYYLTSCVWNTTKEDIISDETTIPTEYTASCIYKAIIDKQGVKTYKCSVDYIGKVYKNEDIKSYKYKIIYTKNDETILNIDDKESNNVIQYITPPTIIVIIFLIYISSKNATLYSIDKNSNKKKIKKLHINKKFPFIDITKIEKKFHNDKYILELNHKLYEKIRGKNITIKNCNFKYEKNINDNTIKF